VTRGVLVLLLALITFDVSGLAALCGEPGGDEDCPADASGGDCAPNCRLCQCCSLPTFTKPTLANVGGPLLSFQRSIWIQAAETPTAPDPAGILHVPKPLLA
jgi:hypothetical protein